MQVLGIQNLPYCICYCSKSCKIEVAFTPAIPYPRSLQNLADPLQLFQGKCAGTAPLYTIIPQKWQGSVRNANILEPVR